MKPYLILFSGLLLIVLATASPFLSLTAPPSAWELILPDEPTRIWRSPWYDSNHTLYVITGHELRRTTDDGQSWEILYASSSLGVNSMAFDPAGTITPTLFVAGLDGPTTKIYRSNDDGQSWQLSFSLTNSTPPDLVAMRDQNQQLIIVLVGGNQLWRSTNGGDSWHPAGTGLPEWADLYRVYASPNFANDQTLYATGFGRLVRSQNGGEQWAEVIIPQVDIARQVIFSPAYASDHTLWVSHFAIEGSGEYPPNGVVRSNDGGQSWQDVSEGLPVDYLDGWIMGLTVSPNSPAELYTIERALQPVGTSWNLFRSLNRGDSWAPQGSAPDATPNGLLLARPGLLFLPTQNGLWRLQNNCWQSLVNGDAESDDGWQMPTTPATAGYSTVQAHGGNRSIRVGIIDDTNRYAYSSALQAVTLPAGVSATLTSWLYPVATSSQLASPSVLNDPAGEGSGDAQYILILDEELQIIETLLWTLDNSQSWQSYSADLSHYAGQSFYILFGVYNDGLDGIAGMYVDDSGLTACGPTAQPLFLPTVLNNWQAPAPPAGPLLIAGQWAKQVIGHPQSTVIYGRTSLGLYRSNDGGVTWILMNPSPPNADTILLAANQPDILYAGDGYPCLAGGDDQPFWKSVDSGQSWQEVPAGLNLQPLAVHPNNATWLYARGCNGPYRSNDGGQSWQWQGDDLFLTYEGRLIAPAGAWQTVYVGGVSEGGSGIIIGSQQGGQDWKRLTPLSVDVWWISALAVDPRADNSLYFGEPHAFWGSLDGGNHWYTSTNGLEDVVYDPAGPITQSYGLLSLAYNPLAPDQLLLGTIRGVYQSPDLGQHWSKMMDTPYQTAQVKQLLWLLAWPNRLFVTTPAGVYLTAPVQ